jgi:transposase InsO family protein
MQEIRAHWRPGMTAAETAELAGRFGCDPRTVWRVTRDLRPRRRRRDGRPDEEYRREIGDELLIWLVGLIDRGVPHDVAIRAARAAGKAKAGEVTVYVLRRALKAAGYRTREMRRRGAEKPDGSRAPVIKRSYARHHANSLHHYDETRAPAMYVDESDGSLVFDPLSGIDPDARQAGKTPFWVAGVLDDASRACHLAPIPTPSAEVVLDALAEAWLPKDDPRMPFFGLPELVYADNGSWANSETVREFLGLAGVKSSCHHPYQPWAKGKIERLFRTTNPFWILSRLERTRLVDTDQGGVRRKVLRMRGAEVPAFFARLNLYLNGRRQSSTGEIPYARWIRLVSSSPTSLRAPPPREAFEAAKLCWVETRVDPLCTVRLPGGERIGLDYGLFAAAVGRPLRVGFRRRERDRPVAPQETIQVLWKGRRFEAERREFAPAGRLDWRDQPRTPGEELAARAAKVDYSGDDLTRFAEREARPYTLSVAPVAFDLSRLAGKLGEAARRCSRLEALERLQEAGVFARPMTSDDRARAAAWFGSAEIVDVDRLETIIATGDAPAADTASAAG